MKPHSQVRLCLRLCAFSVAFLTAIYGCANDQTIPQNDRIATIKKIENLDISGEYFPEESIAAMKNDLPIIFALTQNDFRVLYEQEERGYQPREEETWLKYWALFNQLSQVPDHQVFARDNFSTIQHPGIKFWWAMALFYQQQENDAMLQYLRARLEGGSTHALLSDAREKEFLKDVNGRTAPSK